MILKETSTAYIRFYPEECIIHAEFKPDFEMEIEEARENIDAILSIIDRRCYFILDGSHSDGYISTDAQKYISQYEKLNQYRIMNIIIIKNLAQRILANFYGKLNRSGIPYKVMRSKNDAFVYAKEKNCSE